MVLDIHDPVPEFYAAKFAGTGKSTFLRFVRWLEQRYLSLMAELAPRPPAMQAGLAAL